MTERLVEERLGDLRRRTEALRPRPGFEALVLGAIAARAAMTLRRELVRSARLFVPAALLLAAVSVGWAARTERVGSAEFAAAEQRWELDW